MFQESAGHTLQPTALVHEAWLRLADGGQQNWKGRAYFFAAAAEAMRRILVEHARRKARLKHGGGQERLNIEDLDLAETAPNEKILLVDEALEQSRRQQSGAGAGGGDEVFWWNDEPGSRRNAGNWRAYGGSSLGVCQSLAVSKTSECQVTVVFVAGKWAETTHE